MITRGDVGLIFKVKEKLALNYSIRWSLAGLISVLTPCALSLLLAKRQENIFFQYEQRHKYFKQKKLLYDTC